MDDMEEPVTAMDIEAGSTVDPVPTSSSDVNVSDITSSATDFSEQEDTISSSTVVEPDSIKSKEFSTEDLMNRYPEQLTTSDINMIIMGETSVNNSKVVTDTDYFNAELNIANVSAEKITEDVEDIVQDLENLLGESGDDYVLNRNIFNSSKESSHSTTVCNQTEDIKARSDTLDFGIVTSGDATASTDTSQLLSSVTVVQDTVDSTIIGDGQSEKIAIIEKEELTPAEDQSQSTETPPILTFTQSAEAECTVTPESLIVDAVEEQVEQEIVADQDSSPTESKLEETVDDDDFSETQTVEILESQVTEIVPDFCTIIPVDPTAQEVEESDEICNANDNDNTELEAAIAGIVDSSVEEIDSQIIEDTNSSNCVMDQDNSETFQQTYDDIPTNGTNAEESKDMEVNDYNASEPLAQQDPIHSPETFDVEQTVTNIDIPIQESQEIIVDASFIPTSAATQIPENTTNTTDVTESSSTLVNVVECEVPKQDDGAKMFEITNERLETAIQSIECEKKNFELSENLDQVDNENMEVNLDTSAQSDVEMQNIEENREITDIMEVQEEVETVVEDSKNVEAVVEDSINMEAVVEDSKNVEAVVEDSINMEAVIEDSKNVEAVVEDSINMEAVVEDSKNVEAVVEDSINMEAVVEDSINMEAVVEDSKNMEAVVEDSKNLEAVVEDPKDMEAVEAEDLSEIIDVRFSAEEQANESTKPQNLEPERDSNHFEKPLTVEVEDVANIDSGHHQTESHIEDKHESIKKIPVVLGVESPLKTPPVDTSRETEVEGTRSPLRITITKHKTDNTHSILKIYDPNETEDHKEDLVKSQFETKQVEEATVPKIIIKSITQSSDHSPRSTVNKSSEIVTDFEQSNAPLVELKATVDTSQHSPKTSAKMTTPKITIKPIVKPDPVVPKLTIKPIPKPEHSETHERSNTKLTVKSAHKSVEEITEHHSPKITIKPIRSPEPSHSHSTLAHSPKITIKPIIKPQEVVSESEGVHIPKLTIKPIHKPASEDAAEINPRVMIKPVIKPDSDNKSESDKAHSPKITIKPVVKPADTEVTHSPRITIKPIVKPPEESSFKMDKEERSHSPRITIKPIVKPPEEDILRVETEERHSPRITIKPIVKPTDQEAKHESEGMHSPRITIKPIVKPPELDEQKLEVEEVHSPRITIKPIVKPSEQTQADPESEHLSPRITIKPIVKPSEESVHEKGSSSSFQPLKLHIKPIAKPDSPKITIKPIPKSSEDIQTIDLVDFDEEIKPERIVLKINKNTKTSVSNVRENKKERHSDEGADKTEKLKKIKLKFSKEGGHAHIVQQEFATSFKRSAEASEHDTKKIKIDSTPELTISLISPGDASKSEKMPFDGSMNEESESNDMIIEQISFHGDKRIVGCKDITITPIMDTPMRDVARHEKSIHTPQDVLTIEEIADPLADIPVFEITPETAVAMKNAASARAAAIAASSLATPTPRKRGRPRKIPLEVRPDFKDNREEEPAATPQPAEESSRPKRSCRGPSVRTTLGIKPRKPRGPGRGRGGKRGMGSRAPPMKKPKQPKLSAAKLKLLRETGLKETDFRLLESRDVEFKHLPPPESSSEVVVYEEETRMSADSSSRAQTPAKQVLVSSAEGVEESQSSVQSSTTTESEKVQKARRGPRLEVHQEPEGEVISADKLAEYSWGGGGPFMLQEQVAQFLGIKSFKRKYPGIHRRPLEMQERDFIRESGLASEAMCDMGLTAVKSEDILDIMYTDFQNKYEEYCKHQRDRQAKDVSNKQKALSLAASQEKNKLDMVEQAVQSASHWNATFNRTRREQRKACMDLQTFTINFPKGKIKQVNKTPVGHYPIALVPGQFTDYYKPFTPSELASLPLNTLSYKTFDMDDSQSDDSGSDSDSSSSDSDSSCSGSSGAEDCKTCNSQVAASAKKLLAH